jgi:hypothetical protein
MTAFPEKDPDPRAQTAAETFDRMARLVTDNLSNGFSGAFAIIPPGEGELHTVLLLDPSENVAAFWMLVQSKASLALKDLEDAERAGNAFGRR